MDKQELLTDILAGYSLLGIPTLDMDDDAAAAADADDLTPRHSASMFRLERSWTDVVRDHESMDKRHRDYQEAVWELLSTELDHIAKLRVVVDVRHTHARTHARTHTHTHIIYRHRYTQNDGNSK